METTLEFLKRKLKEAGPERWPSIVEQTGVAKSLPRKLAYGDRPNPGIQTVQPLLDYFQRQDASALGAAAATQNTPRDPAAGPAAAPSTPGVSTSELISAHPQA